MKATMTIGIPCSGKSTWARETCRKNGNVLNVNRDDLRFALTGHDGWGTYKFKRPIENMITAAQKELIRLAAEQKKDIIVSDTNLGDATRLGMEAYLKTLGYAVEFKYFPIALKEAYQRDALRENGVGQDVIYSMYLKYLKLTGRRVYTPDETKPKAVIVDVDGTVAKMINRSPYDWDKVKEDQPREHILSMVDGLVMSGITPIFLSGRDGVCAEDTFEWLVTHSDSFDAFHHFFIREQGDIRPDTVVKEEIFWREISPHYNVVMAIDDRPGIVRLWHELGIQNVVAVGNPYVEF